MQLPVVIKNEINTPLSDALPLCIILAYSDIKDWFLLHYINICSITTMINNTYDNVGLRFLEGGLYLDRHKTREVLEYNPIYIKPLADDFGLVASLKANLQAGFYVIAFFDEFYLKQKSSYEKNNFIHESLIYGYSDVDDCFYGISFNKNGLFTSLNISYKEAAEGIMASFAHSTEFYLFNYIYAIKPIDRKFHFKLDSFVARIKDYLYSDIDSIDKQHLFLNNKTIGNFSSYFMLGIKVYDELIKIYTSAGYEKPSNNQFMNFHIFSEQKKHILFCLHYINDNIFSNNFLMPYIKSYEEILNEHNKLRLSALKSQEKKDNKSIFVNKIDRLTRIKNMEGDLLSKNRRLFY